MWKRFRFSLLSLLVGMVLAGGVVTLNLRPPGEQPTEIPEIATYGRTIVHSVGPYGWPFDVCRTAYVTSFFGGNMSEGYDWRWPGLAANIAIGLAIVFGGAGVCEYVVRRLAAKVE